MGMGINIMNFNGSGLGLGLMFMGFGWVGLWVWAPMIVSAAEVAQPYRSNDNHRSSVQMGVISSVTLADPDPLRGQCVSWAGCTHGCPLNSSDCLGWVCIFRLCMGTGWAWVWQFFSHVNCRYFVLDRQMFNQVNMLINDKGHLNNKFGQLHENNKSW